MKVQTQKQIKQICKHYGIEKYIINADNSLDVIGTVNLFNMELRDLPLRFNHVLGNFLCHNNKLTTLKGAPVSVGLAFHCDTNQLTSMKHCPSTIGTRLTMERNFLTMDSILEMENLEIIYSAINWEYSCFDQNRERKWFLNFAGVDYDKDFDIRGYKRRKILDQIINYLEE